MCRGLLAEQLRCFLHKGIQWCMCVCMYVCACKVLGVQANPKRKEGATFSLWVMQELFGVPLFVFM